MEKGWREERWHLWRKHAWYQNGLSPVHHLLPQVPKVTRGLNRLRWVFGRLERGQQYPLCSVNTQCKPEGKLKTPPHDYQAANLWIETNQERKKDTHTPPHQYLTAAFLIHRLRDFCKWHCCYSHSPGRVEMCCDLLQVLHQPISKVRSPGIRAPALRANHWYPLLPPQTVISWLAVLIQRVGKASVLHRAPQKSLKQANKARKIGQTEHALFLSL